jgi:hypothetical protein
MARVKRMRLHLVCKGLTQHGHNLLLLDLTLVKKKEECHGKSEVDPSSTYLLSVNARNTAGELSYGFPYLTSHITHPFF